MARDQRITREEERSDKHRSSRHKDDDSSRTKSASATGRICTLFCLVGLICFWITASAADGLAPRRTVMLCRNEDMAVGFTILVGKRSEGRELACPEQMFEQSHTVEYETTERT